MAQFDKNAATVAHEQDAIRHHTPEESLEPQARGENYYCEAQKGSFCQIHAANAFLGYGAIRPSQLAAFVQIRANGFAHENVEGLAAGGLIQEGRTAGDLLNIEGGVDLGMAVEYMHHLEETEALRGSVANIEVGDIVYSQEDGLLFENHTTGVKHKVDNEFLETKSRAMLGTFAPVHAGALRKNTDNTWTEIDSLNPGQRVIADLQTGLIETVIAQEAGGGRQVKLPCAFM